jgi:GNAT superfamily N-acetyltransferase
VTLRVVETTDDWSVVSNLWQLFRYDVSLFTGALPRASGRYSTRDLALALGSNDHAGYVWWESNEHGAAPGGFAIVGGLTGARRTFSGFWVAPVLRRSGVGRLLALDVLERHPAPWAIAFQHHNSGAGSFWRQLADEAFGPCGVAWNETERLIPGMPEVPPDHWIETL